MNAHVDPAAAERMSHAAPPPGAAATLYVGKVMHARLKPVAHRFDYRVFNLLLDLDRLDEADGMARLFSVNRRNALSFHEDDHRPPESGTLRDYADGLLAEAGLGAPAARILLACYPRVLGRVFNPLAVYYAYRGDGTLAALVYEVRNTFGERHTYVCPVAPAECSPAGIRQTRAKRFHVSPFIGMDMRYHFRMGFPGETMRWRILETDGEGPLLAATYNGRARALSDAALADCLLRIPLQTWKIVGAIHYEALRLWLKGAAYRTRGTPPPPVSIGDAETDFRALPRSGAGRPPPRDGMEGTA